MAPLFPLTLWYYNGYHPRCLESLYVLTYSNDLLGLCQINIDGQNPVLSGFVPFVMGCVGPEALEAVVLALILSKDMDDDRTVVE